MKPTTKKYLISAAAAAAVIASTAGIASAHMLGMFGGPNNGEFAKSLATRFNLNQVDVETFLTQQMTARIKAEIDARLTKAVTAGKITETQKQLIIAKEAEIEPKVLALKNITDKEALKTAAKAIQDELKAWATANNIPFNVLGGPMGHGMMGFKGRMGMQPKQAQ